MGHLGGEEVILTPLWLLLSCWQEPVVPVADPIDDVPFALTKGAVPGFPDLRESHSAPLLLHRLPSDMRWPTPGGGGGRGDAFTVELEPLPNPRGASRVLEVFRASLPFSVDPDEQVFRPEGMSVTLDGEPLPFSRVPAPMARRSTWRIAGRDLVVTHSTLPSPGAVQITYPGVTEAWQRWDPAAASGRLSDHALGSLTLERVTRTGMRLPAPGVAEWTVTLPPGPVRFRSHVALERPPIPGVRSDGATAVLSVVVGDLETEVGRLRVTSDRKFTEMKADLSAFAEQDVTLRLVTDSGPNARFDWVFFGAPTVWGPPQGDVRRVVVIGIDTTRPDHLSFFGYNRPTTPELDAVLGKAAVFERTWSVAPRTRPAFRSATTGLRPLEAVGAESLGATLSRHGFATGALVANVHLQPRFGFSDGYDRWRFDGKAKARSQVDGAVEWLNAHLDRDSFFFLHLMDPHMRYDAPGVYHDRFVTDPDPDLPRRFMRAQVFGWNRQGLLSAQRKAHIEALHDGELAYTSAELGRLFTALDRMPGRSMVVIHTDHGEEFWEHGGFEHNHTLYDEVTRALLAFRPRGGLPEGVRLDVPASLLDLAPTVYDLLGVTDGPVMHGRSLVPQLKGEPGGDLAARGLPVAYLQYRRERWGVVVQDHKYVLHTGSGLEELYDLKRDPGEQNDLASVRDLAPYRRHLRHAHRVPVGPGLRIRLEDAPAFTLALPIPARVADVLDPETLIDHRANVEWGEVPEKLPGDVGVVELSTDGRSIRFVPGVEPSGVLVAMFDDGTGIDPSAITLTVGEQQRSWSNVPKGVQWASDGGRKATIALHPGVVLVPPPTEADRMGIGPGAVAAVDETKLLCDLGYLTDCDVPKP